MARDFIYIDSDKVKTTLKNALEMGEGDMSGNKLGLSSKIVPTVNLNNYPVLQTVVNASHTAVQNVWREIHVTNAKALWCAYRMETLAEDIEYEFIINGVTFAGARAASVAGTVYFVFISFDGTLETTTDRGLAAFYDGLSASDFIFRVRKTSAGGANNLNIWFVYEQW